jgi:hypothetical protein
MTETERYRRVSVRMWGDERFRKLTPSQPCGQSLWVYLLTGPQTTNMPGVIPVAPAVIAAALRWPAEAFAKALREGLREGMIQVDDEAGLIWLPNAKRHNRPESPNVVVSWRRTWELVPECPLKAVIWRNLKAFTEGLGEAFAKAFAKGCPQPSRNQDQDQDQDQDPERVCEPASAPAAPPTAEGPLFDRSSESRSAKKPEKPPMPYSVSELLSTLASASGGRVATKPFDQRLAPALTGVIRALADEHVKLDDLQLAGEWIAAGGLAWMRDPPGVPWLATTGMLCDAVAKARQWQAAGRPKAGTAGAKDGRPTAAEVARQAIELEAQGR